jgi:hypothetical protein
MNPPTPGGVTLAGIGAGLPSDGTDVGASSDRLQATADKIHGTGSRRIHVPQPGLLYRRAETLLSPLEDRRRNIMIKSACTHLEYSGLALIDER